MATATPAVRRPANVASDPRSVAKVKPTMAEAAAEAARDLGYPDSSAVDSSTP